MVLSNVCTDNIFHSKIFSKYEGEIELGFDIIFTSFFTLRYVQKYLTTEAIWKSPISTDTVNKWPGQISFLHWITSGIDSNLDTDIKLGKIGDLNLEEQYKSIKVNGIVWSKI